ncbi:MAG: DNA gyrase inhibitor YacG [Bdellovibrionales bacterium]|nr:DNA gyrase inhibitor YacG [Bdellovibrionales bacterium]
MQSDRHACRHCGKICNKTVITFPFCCERCRVLDLGSWATETYKISSGKGKMAQSVTRFSLCDRGK